MGERYWAAAADAQLAAAIRATFGVMRFGMRGERRAVGAALEPTEQVLAVAGCGFEIARQGATARHAIAAMAVVTDRRLIFARKLPFRPASLDEVARRELPGAAVEVDASGRRVVVAADAVRVTLRNLFGSDAMEAMPASLGVLSRGRG